MAKILMKDIKLGAKYRLATDRLALTGYPGFNKGDEVTISYKNGNNINIANNKGQSVNAALIDLAKIDFTKEEIQKEIKVKEDEIDALKVKLNWMLETNSNIYSEKEFKIWKMLQAMNGDTSNTEKARLLAALMD